MDTDETNRSTPRGMLRKYIPADERTVLSLRPNPLFVLIRSFWALVLIILTTIGLRYAAAAIDDPALSRWAFWLGFSLGLATVTWQVLEWLSRLYIMTDRRLIAVAGVLRQNVSDVPLRNVRNLVITRCFIER